MKMQNPRLLVSKRIILTLLVSDIVAVAIAHFLARLTYHEFQRIFLITNTNQLFTDNIFRHDLIFVLIFPFILFLFFTKGHYTQRVPWWNQVQHIVKICLMAFVFDGFVRFALEINVSRLMIGFTWIYVAFLVLLVRQAVFYFSQKYQKWSIPTVLLGDIDTTTDLLFAFDADRYTGYDVHTIFIRDSKDKIFDIHSLPARYQNLTIIRDNSDYANYIRDNLDQFFVISMETFRGSERDDVINALTKSNALFAIVPPISRMHLFEMEPRYFFGFDVMLLHAKSSFFSPWGKFLKRSLDLFASSCALLFLIPIAIIVGSLLKAEGQGGTIFYGGYRIGRNGKRFKCWKFRSMEPNTDHLLHELLLRDPIAKADWDRTQKLKNDPRVTTKTARIIRKLSIDELPQLWNVFLGDMSLVGPRPILEKEIPLYGEEIVSYYKSKPGITGLWQVSGRADSSFQRRIYWDSWYVRNWTFWGDIVIILKTIKVVLFGSGAY